MNKKLNRVLALGITLTMAVAATAGCADNGKNTASSKPTLKFLMNNVTTDPNTYPVAQMLEEKTGYKVEYDLLPATDPEEKLNLIIASQTPYDGIQILSALKSKYVDYAKQGALMELDDLIEQYGPNIKKMLSEESLEAMKVNGKTYGIVTANNRIYDENGNQKPNGMNTMLMLRTDLMKKAGVDKIPETVDEFTELLRAIKNKGLGVPLTITATAEIPGLYGAFGVVHEWNEVDGKLVNRVEDPKYKDYLLYVKSLYDEGLLDTEFPTNKTNTVQEKFTSGKAAIMPMAYYDAATVMDSLNANISDAEIEYLLPLKGKDGECGYTTGGTGGGIINRIMVIPESAEHPEDMIKWVNAKLEPETFKNLAIGEEGVHFEIKDGEYYPIAPKFYDERSISNDFLTGVDEKNYQKYWLARVRKDDRIYNAYQQLNTGDKILSMARKSPLSDAPIFDAQQNETVLKGLVTDYSIQVISGAASIDDYDAFLKEWKANGGEALTKEVNEWYANNK